MGDIRKYSKHEGSKHIMWLNSEGITVFPIITHFSYHYKQIRNSLAFNNGCNFCCTFLTFVTFDLKLLSGFHLLIVNLTVQCTLQNWLTWYKGVDGPTHWSNSTQWSFDCCESLNRSIVLSMRGGVETLYHFLGRYGFSMQARYFAFIRSTPTEST